MRYVHEESLSEPFNDPLHCRFGVWLGLGAQARYGHQPGFAEVDLLHRNIHARAARILALCSGGQRGVARSELDGLHWARDQLIARLKALIDHG